MVNKPLPKPLLSNIEKRVLRDLYTHHVVNSKFKSKMWRVVLNSPLQELTDDDYRLVVAKGLAEEQELPSFKVYVGYKDKELTEGTWNIFKEIRYSILSKVAGFFLPWYKNGKRTYQYRLTPEGLAKAQELFD